MKHDLGDLGEPVDISTHRQVNLIHGEFASTLDHSIGAIYWLLWYDLAVSFNPDIAQALKGGP